MLRVRCVLRREPREVAFQMLLDLALGLGQEREAPAIAQRPGGDPHRERPAVPERVEQARPAAQFLDAIGAPREVVLLFARRLLEGVARCRIARGERLALVERLRAHLADVVDAHQRRGVRALGGVEFGFGQGFIGPRPVAARHA